MICDHCACTKYHVSASSNDDCICGHMEECHAELEVIE